MAKFTDKFFNRVIEGKFVAESGDDFSEVLKNVEQFDGEVKIAYSSGNAYIPTANIPSKTGIYKLVYESGSTKETQGVLVFKKESATQVLYSGLHKNVVFKANISGAISNLQITLQAVSSGTKLYRHEISDDTTGGALTIINTSNVSLNAPSLINQAVNGINEFGALLRCLVISSASESGTLLASNFVSDIFTAYYYDFADSEILYENFNQSDDLTDTITEL